MEKLQIFQILKCNRVLYKMLKQQTSFPFSIGFQLYQIMKKFDEVESYVFNIMDMLFGKIDLNNMTEEQEQMYSSLVLTEIEIQFDKIPLEKFKNNDKLTLTIEDMKNLEIILDGIKQ